MNNRDPTFETYGALIDSYINTIFQSGLLLDEDLQILTNYYKHEPSPEFSKYKVSLTLKLSVSTLLGSCILVGKLGKWILVPSVLATAVATVLEIKNTQENRRQRKLVEDVVNISKRINALNTAIKKYVKTRIEIEEKTQNDFFKSYNRQIEEFFKNMFSNEVKFFETVMGNLETVANFSDDLDDDFNAFKNFDPLNEHQVQLDSLETGLKFLIQSHDLHIWLTSKLLSYMSIAFLSPNQNLNENAMKKLLNDTLSSLLNFITQHHSSTRQLFSSLRNSITKLSDLRSQQSKPQISNKLHNTLMSAVDNLSIITEKSQTILAELDTNDGTATSVLEPALVDLRNHTYATYESLDLLCRLYGILSTKSSQLSKSTISKIERRPSREDKLATIHHDDAVDPVEENFELYLDKDYEVPVEESNVYKEDTSGAYLGLMLQELKQSLRKHERFIEAKKRRGSVENEEENEKETQPVPIFDLNALKVNPAGEGNKSLDEQSRKDNLSETSYNVTVSNAPSLPPPPPPLPTEAKTFQLEELADVEYNSKSMFRGIKTLSSQLNIQEDVFGESGNEDDEYE